MSTNTSRKTTDIATAKKSRSVITLDASQYAIYQSGYLDIVAPDGTLLTGVGRAVERKGEELTREEGENMLYLLENLILNAEGGLELTERATVGLAEVIARANTMLAR